MSVKIFSSQLIMSLVIFLSAITSYAFSGEGKSKEKNIVEIAIESEKFNTLTKALSETGLVEALKGEGPYTVFAPTDDAFAKLPEGTIESLLQDKETLKSILLYHVVSGSIMSSEVVKLDKAETLSGKNISIKLGNGSVMINDSKVVKADIKASNGVIHIIDTVLIPE